PHCPRVEGPGRVTSTVQTPEILADIAASPVLGVRVHHVTMPQAVQAVRRMLAAGGAHQIVTANGVMLVRAARDEQVRRALSNAALVIADGAGVVLAARILGRPVFARVPGVELVGGTLDVLAGRVRRAPRLIQQIGLGWAFRLIQEPRRWRVVISLPLLVALALKERVKERWTRRR